MSELIKENTTESLIAMTRLRPFTLLGLVLSGLLLFSVAHQAIAINSSFILSSPDVWAWGITGEPELGDSFDVWADVTDDDSDVRNVTLHVIGPNMTLHNAMTFNGSFYNAPVPAFPNSGTFNIYLTAYNMENESRISTNVMIDYDADPEPVIDPNITLPVVVGSSAGLMVLVMGFAMLYDRKRGLEARTVG